MGKSRFGREGVVSQSGKNPRRGDGDEMSLRLRCRQATVRSLVSVCQRRISIVSYGVVGYCIVGFGARAVSRKTPTYFMIIIKIMIRMIIIIIKIMKRLIMIIIIIKIFINDNYQENDQVGGSDSSHHPPTTPSTEGSLKVGFNFFSSDLDKI